MARRIEQHARIVDQGRHLALHPRAELQALHERPAWWSPGRRDRRARPRGRRRGAPRRVLDFAPTARRPRSNGRTRGGARAVSHRCSPVGSSRKGSSRRSRSAVASSGSARGSTSSASRKRQERLLPSRSSTRSASVAAPDHGRGTRRWSANQSSSSGAGSTLATSRLAVSASSSVRCRAWRRGEGELSVALREPAALAGSGETGPESRRRALRRCEVLRYAPGGAWASRGWWRGPRGGARRRGRRRGRRL